ncbi:MAG TPA: Ig-like domain-containing protein [Kofleriaceae bacterium]|nr:Ig-like domain-containing protein [Kofleriaceae bacterium]
MIGVRTAEATTFTVTTTQTYNGDGTCDSTCTLYEAVQAANAAPAGPHRIEFAIPGSGVQKIAAELGIATLTAQNVTVDGFTQPGASPGSPKIEIDFFGIGAAGGNWTINGANAVIRGLVINGARTNNAPGTALNINAPNVHVEGCFIGTDATGTAARSNIFGIQIGPNGTNTVIGGPTAAQRNIISGNTFGIDVHATGVSIIGNYFGTDVTGTAAIPNTSFAIEFGAYAAMNMKIGGPSTGERNIISGNGTGISGARTGQPGASGCVLQNNWIGVSATGVALPNTNGGLVDNVGLFDTVIDNVISGNTNAGGTAVGAQISAFPGASYQFIGNRVGTDPTGTFAVPNDIGVVANIAQIGSSATGLRNVISGNRTVGVRLNAVTDGTLVRGNYIGVGSNGTTPLPNGGAGIESAGATNAGGTITIGGVSQENIIANNLGGGIVVTANRGTSIQANVIQNNTGLAIDLGTAGVTPNDAGDTDTGPNDLQNFPLVTIAPNGMSVSGTLTSTANRLFSFDVYSNSACDSSGNGEAEAFLGSINALSNGSGVATFTLNVSTPLAAGRFVTAVARDAGTGQGAGNTSELSACVAVPNADLSVTLNDTADPIDVGGTISWTATVANAGPTSATGVSLAITLPAGVNVASTTPSQGTCSQTGSVVTCAFGTIANAGNASVTISGTATSGGTLSTSATVTSNEPDPDSGDRTDTESTTVNRPPTATAANVTTNEDTAVGITLAATDPDGNALTFTVLTNPTKGTLSGTAPNLTFTPNANASGADSFTFRVSDGRLQSAAATISITITAVNDAPVAATDSYTGTENVTLNVVAPGVLANDTDLDSTLTATLVTNALKGTVTLQADGSFTYVPNLDANGTDTFVYKATDGTTSSANTVVTINVSGVNSAPIAITNVYAASEDQALVIGSGMGVLANDSDAEGDSLMASVVSSVGHGTLTLDANGGFTYTPAANYNGTDSFTYHVTDGTLSSADVAVMIMIAGANDLPTAPELIAPADTAQIQLADVELSWQPASDIDGEALMYRVTLNGGGETKTIDTATTAAVLPAAMLSGGAYVWTVQALDAVGPGPTSDTNSFQIIDDGDEMQPGEDGGCCDSRSSDGSSSLVLAIGVLLIVGRRRRQSRALRTRSASHV